jgi:hypothetical protein
MADAPAVKPWCKDDKDKLQNLIDNGKVNITKMDNIEYIDTICHRYFRGRGNLNFRRNFRSYARSLAIAKHYDGYRARLAAGQGKLLLFVLNILHHI